MPAILAITDLTPTLTFIITCCTLLTLIGGFTIAMFSRFRRKMTEDITKIVKKEAQPILESQASMSAKIATLSEGLTAATDLASKVHSDLNGRDGLFARVSYIEALNGVKRTEPVATVHNEVGAT